MGLLIAAYSKNAYKEFILPAVNDADYSITLDRDLFEIEKSIELELEVSDGEWRFCRHSCYQLSKNGNVYFGETLYAGDIILLDALDVNRISLLIMETENNFGAFRKFNIGNLSTITIGTEADNNIRYDLLGLVSRYHAVIRRNGDAYIIEDCSANGIFMESGRLQKSHKLEFGDCINIFGLRIVFLGSVLAVRSWGEAVIADSRVLKDYIAVNGGGALDSGISYSPKVKKYHRSPRNLPKLHEEPIELESPPSPKPFSRRPILMTIGPSFTMALPMMLGCLLAIYSMRSSGLNSGMFMYTGIITAVGSAVLGAMWALINLRYEKKVHREEEDYRFAAYSEYLVGATEVIKQQYEENHQAMCRLYPDSDACAEYGMNTQNLWNRNTTHDDFLFVRLGLGDVAFQVPISIPKQKFSLVKDSLAEKPSLILDNYRMLHNVPVGVNLYKHRVIGVIGTEESRNAVKIMHNIVVQLAACHCYTDVKMAFVYSVNPGAEKTEWDFAKWLPHVWSEDKKSRYVASDKVEAGDVFYELSNLLRVRMEDNDGLKGEGIKKPHYVLFVEKPSMIEGELISKYVFEREENVGLTTILMANSFEELPNNCDYIIRWDNDFCGAYNVQSDTDRLSVLFDLVSEEKVEAFARRIAGVEVNEMETGGELPSSLEFLEMYKVASPEQLRVAERWRKNRTYDTMKALVGQKAGGADCYLDIHEKYHGPHGLIAGTTGSGKSETLQTYILSLAINFSPFDVAFFIIDFKGGGMANLFSNLPHTIGHISNLSGSQVHRAMISVKSENMRRQRIFSEFGVNHINAYTRLLKSGEATVPVPHLFIIIDEFAELKREQPEFMRELISVAQVGRSLGVHLILATQKPSGTVDDNIWSNAKFRLCLRVQDRQDSNDMLHKPDAAYITQAGRCYMQVGNDEVFELFQSGWSGAVYRENSVGTANEIAKMYSLTGKAALVGSRILMREHFANRLKWLVDVADGLKNASLAIGVSLLECQENAEHMSNLLEHTFDILGKMKVDYADTPYNRRCLTEMVQVWNLLDEPEQSTKQTTELVIRQAPLLGMKLPEMKEKTQLDAVIEHIENVAEANGYVNCMQLWLPVLPEKLYLKQIEDYSHSAFADGSWKEKSVKWNLETMIGLYDDPVNQSQKPLSINLAENGHHAVCGTVVSGKSTFLQTLIYSFICKYTPQELNIYALDFSSNMLSVFENDAHIGGIMSENDSEKTDRFFHMMSIILEERKKLFKGGNYSQYVQVHGVSIPSIMIVIDNFAGFREKTKDAYEDIMIKLSRDGAGYGIFLVVSAAGFGSLEIPNRIGDNIRTVISLEMGDKFKYADVMHTMKVDVLPEPGIRGRGLAFVDGSLLEFQTALALEADDDYERAEKISEQCRIMTDAWTGKRARKVPEIPEKPIWGEFVKEEGYSELINSKRCLPIGYNRTDASVYGLDLAYTYFAIIQGKARTGKTNVLRNLISSSADMGGSICVIGDSEHSLKQTAEKYGVRYIYGYAELFSYWQELLPEFQKRNASKRAYVADGLETEEIYAKMSKEYEPIWIFMADVAEFVKTVYSPSDGMGDMSGFLTNIIEKGSQHGIYFIGGFNHDDIPAMAPYRLFNCMTDYHTGIHLGGNVAGQRMFDFTGIPFVEQTRPAPVGTGLVPAGGNEISVTEVVIPLYGGKTNE